MFQIFHPHLHCIVRKLRVCRSETFKRVKPLLIHFAQLSHVHQYKTTEMFLNNNGANTITHYETSTRQDTAWRLLCPGRAPPARSPSPGSLPV